MHKYINLGLALFLFLLIACGGGENKKNNKNEFEKSSNRGQATGYATIFDGDTALARDRATEDAKNKLVTKILGETISGTSIMKNYELVSSIVEAKSYGLVKDVEIIKQWQEGNETFITIEGTIDQAALEDAIEATLERYGRPKFMVLIKETFEGENNFPGFTETEMILQEIMGNVGFEFVDTSQTQELISKEKRKMKKAMQGKISDDVQDLLLNDAGAEILIIGTAQTKDQSKALKAYGAKNMQSKSAIIRIKAIDIYTGKILSITSQNAPGVHIEADTASKKAIENALKKIIGKIDRDTEKFTPGNFMAKIIEKFVKAATERQINLLITGLSYKEVKKLKNNLSLRIRGVKKIRNQKQIGQAVKLELYFSGKTNDLADELLAKAEKMGYEITVKETFPNKLFLNIITKK